MEQKTVYVTRKIQLLINNPDVDFKKRMYHMMYHWQWICFKAANHIFTHHYLQDQIKELIYITEDVKVKLADIHKDKDGILTTSKESTTYQLLSKFYKGEVPMNMLAALNHELFADFNKDREAYWKGTRSIRNYKRNIALPFPAICLKMANMDSGKDFQFTLFQIPFKTYLGKDRSDKYVLMKRLFAGNLKLCRSALKLEKNKVFLLATFQMEKDDCHDLDESIIAEASLSLENPIALAIGKKSYLIGNKEEFLHRRIAMQNARRRLQTGSVFNRAGKGRKRKMKCADQYRDQEKRYVDYKLHVYSKRLIDLCIKHRAGTILLVNQQQKEQMAKEDEFLLQNWSYCGLKEKIQHKADRAGITVISE